MKKGFIFLLVVSLLLTCAYGFAEEEKKEITFRGIPWGSSIPDYLSAIAKDSLSGNPSKIYNIYSWENKEGNDMDESVSVIEDGGYYVNSYPKAMSVAGVPVERIYAYFMFTFDDNALFTDEEKVSLYKAEYDLAPVDIGETFDILTTKLTGLYGQGTKAHGSQKYINTTYTDDYDTVTWYGPNDTGVRLFTHYRAENGAKEYRSLSLIYGKTNSVDLFKELTEAMAREQKKEMLTDNTDGL